jgi:hypothetical protein
MRAAGTGFRAIACKLNDDGIISPREYYYHISGRKNPCRTNRMWSETSIKDIIKNEVYIGNIVQGKAGTVSYKNPKMIGKPREEWIRVQSTHEPLIKLELWERVQAFIHKKYKPRRRSDGGTNLYAGLLYCADCGFKLRGQVERRMRKDGSEYIYISYMCGTYAHSGKDACTVHRISENALNDIITELIRAHIQMIEYDEERIIEAVLSAQSNETMSYRAVYQSELESHGKQIEKLDLLIENLYADKISGLVPDSLFKRQIVKYEQDRSERIKSIKTIEQRIKNIKLNADDAFTWSNLMKQYSDLTTLDAETLFLLIDKIIISEAQIIDGKRICDIKIVYNYIGDIDRLAFESGDGA